MTRYIRCPACEKMYEPHAYWQRYCSPKCRQWSYRERQKEAHVFTPPKPKKPLPYVGYCQHCGEDMFSHHRTKRYCCAACKQAAYRLRLLVYDVPLVEVNQ